MSGSNYTLTPNYGLFKPVPNADNDVWGDHINASMDTLDSTLKTIENKAGVTSWNTRTGVVSLTNADVLGVLPGSNAQPAMDGLAAAGTATTWSRADHQHPVDTSRYAASNPAGYVTAAQVTTSLAPYAPLASPILTGNPTAPTPSPGDSDTSIATTAFVASALAGAPVLTVSDTPPPTPAPGALWYDSANTGLYVRYNDGSSAQWVVANSQNIPPDAPSDGTLYARRSGAWAAAAPAAALNDVGRNLLHNPLFNVAQRGAGPWTAGALLTADRWMTSGATDTFSFVIASLTDADRSAIGDEAAQYALQNTFTGSATANAYNQIRQRVENLRRLSGKTIIVSFFARATTGTPKLGLSYGQFFGTGGSPSATVYASVGATPNLSATWTRYSFSVVYPSSTGKVFGTTAGTDYAEFTLNYSDVSNQGGTGVGQQSGTVQLWGVQLEIGTVATPLEKPDPQQDLAKCQRFYQVFPVFNVGGAAVNGVGFYVPLTFPVSMRAAPTITGGMTGGNGYTSPGMIAIGPMGVTATAVGAAPQYIANLSFTASADL